ncbi:hypothetical protein CR513_05093, partial [Mucuna pruriens]
MTIDVEYIDYNSLYAMVHSITEYAGGKEEISAVVAEVLQEFEGLLEAPVGLPPTRRHDHATHLKEGATIPNIQPYRYPDYKNSEIDN